MKKGIAFSQLPEWLPQTINSLEKTAQIVLQNQNYLRDELEKVNQHLEAISAQMQQISAQIDEQVLVGMRSGLSHLINGIYSDSDKVRDTELSLAQKEFTRLMNLNPEGTTKGSSGEYPNMFLVGLGYWGSFHYFNLQHDHRNALLQVYTLTIQSPILGLSLFPAQLFSTNYLNLINSTEEHLNEAISTLETQRGDNFWQNLSHYSKQVLRGTATAIVGAGGFTLTTVTGGWMAHFAGIATLSTFAHLKPTELTIQPTDELEKTIQQLGEQLNRYIATVQHESAMRLQELQKIDLTAETTENGARQYGYLFWIKCIAVAIGVGWIVTFL